ncbi:MAG: amino acid permease [Thermodesulfobacteriota bacterium]
MISDNTDQRKSAAGKLGTFGGVFTPSILTILGIILFSRLGYVVGSAGLGRALVILVIANAISVLTSLSLSAISTNIRVKVGGVYYLISRTLGLEFGGAIGIVMFLAQSVSIAFYCIGFGEVLAAIMSVENIKIFSQIVALLSVAVLFAFAWLGADWATRFQYVVMVFLGTALVSFFIGGIAGWNTEIFISNWSAPENGLPFWSLFAIYFPAVTGFTQGSSMSGDLKDPGKSLPLGTLLAVGLSILIYFAAALLLAGSVPGSILIGDYAAMKRVSLVRFLIDGGVIAATLSSAMASFLGAPRILQSLAADRIFPFLLPFAKGSGPANNPRKAVLLSLGIALATIGLGQLNIIAPVVSMFFLVSYGLLNYATYFEARAASPSFRPRFRWFHARLSLVGALACLGTMLTIDPAAGLVAASVLFAIYYYLKQTSGLARWADSQRAYHLQQVREHLLSAADEPEHPRNWRPHVLLFSEDPARRKPLLDFASWVQGASGFTTVVRFLEGEGIQMLRQRKEAESELQKNIDEHRISAFPLVLTVPDLSVGIHTLVQAFGIGPLRANTILLNWMEQVPSDRPEESKEPYGRNLRITFRLGRNILILDAKPKMWEALASVPSENRRIDVWWQGDATSELMLLLAYLMTRSDDWAQATIRVLAACTETDAEETVENIRKILDDVRIDALPEAVVAPDAQTVAARSRDASMVFLPFRLKGNRPLDPFGGLLEELLPWLPSTALLLAAEDIDLDAEPDEGKPAEIAAAIDQLEDARKKAVQKEAVADKAKQQAEQKQQDVQEAVLTETNAEKLERLKMEAEEARKAAEQASRKAAKAAAKAEHAAQDAEAAGVQLPDTDK